MKFRSIFFALAFLLIGSFVKASEIYQAATQLNIRSGAWKGYGIVSSISQCVQALQKAWTLARTAGLAKVVVQ